MSTQEDGASHIPKGLPMTTHSFYWVIVILSLAFIALIIALCVTIRDDAFESPPSSPRSHYIVQTQLHNEHPAIYGPPVNNGQAVYIPGSGTAPVGDTFPALPPTSTAKIADKV